MEYYYIIMNWNKSYEYLSKKFFNLFKSYGGTKSVKNPNKLTGTILKYNLT